MHLSAPEHGAVLYVASHMRAIDREEVYGLRFVENPFLITNDVMARPEVSWVAWHDQLPAVVFGGVETTPGVWSIYCFATDAFPKLALPLTRFVKKLMLPLLFGTLGAHRLEADSHENHVQAHRWMELCGATREGVKRGRGKTGADYFTFAIVDKTKAQV